jgi:hypothetical protein
VKVYLPKINCFGISPGCPYYCGYNYNDDDYYSHAHTYTHKCACVCVCVCVCVHTHICVHIYSLDSPCASCGDAGPKGKVRQCTSGLMLWPFAETRQPRVPSNFRV